MPTAHISAQPGDFAEVVLMPGDPLRAKQIADSYLSEARRVTAVRNMVGYTGFYQRKRLSVMAHGMGIPSLTIYATELIEQYGVKVLIRVGTCGAVPRDVQLRDVILALGASTDSKVNRVRFLDHDFAAVADFGLLRAAADVAESQRVQVRIGNVFSTDLFYSRQPQLLPTMERMGVLAVEMETAGLYGVAAEYGARALAILTVSDHLQTGEQTTARERQTSFNSMMELALQVALRH